MKNDHYFGIFNLAGPDLQVFRQVKECLTLAWDERMKVPHVIAYFFFCDQGWPAGLLKLMKNDLYKVFLAVSAVLQNVGLVQ